MEVSEKGSMADGAGDGERSSESKFESDDEPVELTGEFGILKMHMDVHFERQARFFEELLTTKSNTILRQRTKESMLKMAGTEMALPEPRVSQGNAALQLPVPQLTTANSFRSTISSSPPGRRDSVRKSFVRAGMEDKQGRARAAASRITFAREGRAHSAADRVDWRGRIQALVISPFFTNFIMFLIVTNAVLLGVEIDVSAKVGQDDIPTWNVFDFTIVTLSVVETMVDWWAQSISSSADGSNSFRVMRALRLVRTLRGFRIIRLFRYFSVPQQHFNKKSNIEGLQARHWAWYRLVTDHCRFMAIEQNADNNAIPACEDNLQPYWVNVMDSMMTLFMSITGGINWFEAYEPLRQVSLMALWLFNLYVVIGFFTILNMVTGVFVNTAIESASADKDIATLKQMQKRLENMSSLREVFQEMNAFNVNEVSLDDLEDALSQNKLGTFMESLGISTDDVPQPQLKAPLSQAYRAQHQKTLLRAEQALNPDELHGVYDSCSLAVLRIPDASDQACRSACPWRFYSLLPPTDFVALEERSNVNNKVHIYVLYCCRLSATSVFALTAYQLQDQMPSLILDPARPILPTGFLLPYYAALLLSMYYSARAATYIPLQPSFPFPFDETFFIVCLVLLSPVWSLFLLIDSDSNGVLDLEEFVTGCMQLRGPAKSLQVAKMRQAIKHLHEDVMQLTRMVKSGLKYRMVKEVL
ncbi:unnamed protein product [Durusdinium trenchii]|uniref:EF-hand domain-containing protein n=1 Tax=Durusdinium trenchii TaxID=1381693 RepID=A0ABP0PMI0_9DINO